MKKTLTALVVLAIALIFAVGLSRDFFYAGWPFHSELNDTAVRKYLFEFDNVDDQQIVSALQEYAKTNGFQASVMYVPVANRMSIRVILEKDALGKFTIDNYLNEKQFICYFYSHIRKESDYKKDADAFKTIFTHLNAHVLEEKSYTK